MCAEADILQIENLKRELFKLIPLQEITGKKEDISFGLLNEDWDRLDKLAKRLPKDSILKSRLVKAFRLLIAALYQAHSKPIFQQCSFNQRITTSKGSLIIQGDKLSNNISNPSTNILKDTDDLEGDETVNWPRHKSFTTQTVEQVNDDIDNVAAGSENEETELSYPYTTPKDDLNKSSTPTFHEFDYNMSNEPIYYSSTQKNTLNFTNKTKLQSTTENKIISFDTTKKKVTKLNDTGLENITLSTISSGTFTTTSSTVGNKDKSVEEFGNQESASPIHVQTHKYTSNEPHSTTDDNNGNTKPLQPFDTNILPEEMYPDSKELPNEDNTDIPQSTTDFFEIASLFSTKNIPIHSNAPRLDEYDVAPKGKSNVFSTKDYSETVDVLFESSTFLFSTTNSDSSEYTEKDIGQDEERTTSSDRIVGPTTSSLSNNSYVTPFIIKTIKSPKSFDYENITQSSTSSYKNYTSSLTSHSSEQYKEENVITDSKTTGTSTVQFQENSAYSPTNNQNISEISYENISHPEDESTTEYFSHLTGSKGIENKTQNNKQTIVETIATKNLPSTSSSPSKITNLSSIQPSSVTYDLDLDNTNDENYQPTINIPISKTTKRLVNGFTKDNMIQDDFDHKSTTDATDVTKSNDRTPSNNNSNIVITNSYSQEYNKFSTTQNTSLDITSGIIPDQETSTTETTYSPKTSTISTSNSPNRSAILTTESPTTSNIWTTKSLTTSTLWTTKSPKSSLPYYFENPLYDESNDDANHKSFPGVESDIDFPESKDALDIFESENESLTTIKPTETFKYFTVAFKKLFESHEANVHTNKLNIYPKGYYTKRRPHQKIVPSYRNGNQCVRVDNHLYRYPTRYHKQGQVVKSDSIYNMPNYIIKSYEAPSKTYPKYFDPYQGGKGIQWFPKQIMTRQKSEER